MVNTHSDIDLIKQFESKGHKVIDLENIHLYLDGSHKFEDIKIHEVPINPDVDPDKKEDEEDNESRPIDKTDLDKVEDLIEDPEIDEVKAKEDFQKKVDEIKEQCYKRLDQTSDNESKFDHTEIEYIRTEDNELKVITIETDEWDQQDLEELVKIEDGNGVKNVLEGIGNCFKWALWTPQQEYH